LWHLIVSETAIAAAHAPRETLDQRVDRWIV
jgi:hypothetical protein